MAIGFGSNSLKNSIVGLGLLAVASLVGAPSLAAPDVANVIGPDECGECHKAEVEVWRGTHHHKTFQELPRKDKAREIADKMGIRRIKNESLCLQCHFTQMIDDSGEPDAVAGISCESCHSAGKAWNDLHSDYGGKEVTRETEDPGHRDQRIAASRQVGMIQPSMIYDWANNCFSCHTVPEEKLVNEGGHPPGSKFELVSWSQGEIRHNVWYTDGKSNPEATGEQKRVMAVVGQMLDLEHALRGVAKATARGDYAVAMAGRAKSAAQNIKKISDAASTPEIAAVLAVAGGVKLTLGNADALNAAADEVATQARAFVANNDGSGLAGVDSMIPGADKYKGSPAR
jgi:hypothetical protein